MNDDFLAKRCCDVSIQRHNSHSVLLLVKVVNLTAKCYCIIFELLSKFDDCVYGFITLLQLIYNIRTFSDKIVELLRKFDDFFCFFLIIILCTLRLFCLDIIRVSLGCALSTWRCNTHIAVCCVHACIYLLHWRLHSSWRVLKVNSLRHCDVSGICWLGVYICDYKRCNDRLSRILVLFVVLGIIVLRHPCVLL